MNRRLVLSAVLLVGAVLAGCASGPKFSEISNSISPVPASEGRIYFFRSSSMPGAAIQPEIRLNGVVVGKSQPGGFFYIDRPAGEYTAAISTETDNTVNFKLDAGETKYLRTSPSLGVMVGRILLDVEDPGKARTEIETLSFTGRTTASPGVSQTATSGPATVPPTVDLQLDATNRPSHVRHLDATMLEGRTWKFPHPRDPGRYGDVHIAFANGVASATNSLSHSSGPYFVKDDMVCIDFKTTDWGHTCYFVIDGAPAAGGTPEPILFTVFGHRTAPLTMF